LEGGRATVDQITHRSCPAAAAMRRTSVANAATALGSSFVPRLITRTRGRDELSDLTALGPSAARLLTRPDSMIDQPGRKEERYAPVPTVSESP
jgi:hypothetical protein